MQRPPLSLMLAALVLALSAGLWTGATLMDHGAVAWAMEALAAPLPAPTPSAQPEAPAPGTAARPDAAAPAKSAAVAKSAPKKALPGLTATTPAFRDPRTGPASGAPKSKAPKSQAKAPGQSPAAASAQGRVYTVQIASFKDPRRAGMMAADLSDQGLSSAVLRTQGKSGAVWYAVRAGELATSAEARELARAAQGLTGQPALVRRLSQAFLARNTVHPAQELAQAPALTPAQAPAAKPAPQAAARPKTDKTAPARPEISAQAKIPAAPEKKAKHPAQAQTAAQTPAPAAEAARPVEERLANAGVEVILTRDGSRPEASAQARNQAQPQASDWVYAVQAAGFNEPGEAQTMARTLAGLGMETSISYLHGWYVVGAGAFPEREQAKARADAVRSATGREPTIHAASRRTLARALWTPEADSQTSGPEASPAPAPSAALPQAVSQPAPQADSAAPRDLMYRVENWGRPDLTGTALVASYRDPREAGGMARQLKSQGVAAMVVYAAGPQPWGVYRKATP